MDLKIATSPEINLIAKALVKAQAKIKTATKDANNPQFKSKYADLGSVIEACRGPLLENGIGIIQVPSILDGKQILKTILLHESGQWIAGDYILNPVKNDPQGMGSVMTYARRYSLASMAGVYSGDDDDGNAASTTKRDDDKKTDGADRNGGSSKYNAALAEVGKQNAKAAASANDKVELTDWGLAVAKKNNVSISKEAIAAFYDGDCKGLAKRDAAVRIREYITDLQSVPG